MTPEAQQIAILKVMGWAETEPWSDGRRCFERKDSPAGWELFDLPDYLNDLNAILAAVKELPPMQKEEVVKRIGWSAVRQCMDYSFIANATAAQWAAAYLKTLKLWKP